MLPIRDHNPSGRTPYVVYALMAANILIFISYVGIMNDPAQINRFLKAGAATFDEGTGRFTVDLDKLEAAITELVRDVCMLQHKGDKAAVEAFLNEFAVMSPPMKKALGSLDGIPVDIRPSYPLAQ